MLELKLWEMFRVFCLIAQGIGSVVFFCARAPALGWAKMHDVFKSLLPRYFLKDIYVKWSQFEFQTIWTNFHYTPSRSKFLLTIIVLANFNCTLVLNFFSINVFQKLQLNYSMDRQCWELSFDIKTFKFDLIVCSEIGKISQISTCVFKN